MAENYNKFIEDRYSDSAIKKRAESLVVEEKRMPIITAIREEEEKLHGHTKIQAQELKYEIIPKKELDNIINNPESVAQEVNKIFGKIERLTNKHINNLISLRDDISLLSRTDINISMVKVQYSKEIGMLEKSLEEMRVLWENIINKLSNTPISEDEAKEIYKDISELNSYKTAVLETYKITKKLIRDKTTISYLKTNNRLLEGIDFSKKDSKIVYDNSTLTATDEMIDLRKYFPRTTINAGITASKETYSIDILIAHALGILSKVSDDNKKIYDVILVKSSLAENLASIFAAYNIPIQKDGKGNLIISGGVLGELHKLNEKKKILLDKRVGIEVNFKELNGAINELRGGVVYSQRDNKDFGKSTEISQQIMGNAIFEESLDTFYALTGGETLRAYMGGEISLNDYMTINTDIGIEINKLYSKYNQLAQTEKSFYLSPKFTLKLNEDLKMIISSTITRTGVNLSGELIQRLNKNTEIVLFASREKIYGNVGEGIANETTKIGAKLGKDISGVKVSVGGGIENRSGHNINDTTGIFGLVEIDMSNLINDGANKSIQEEEVKSSISRAKFPGNIDQKSKTVGTREAKK